MMDLVLGVVMVIAVASGGCGDNRGPSAGDASVGDTGIDACVGHANDCPVQCDAGFHVEDNHCRLDPDPSHYLPDAASPIDAQ